MSSSLYSSSSPYRYQAKANNDYTSIVVQRTDLSNPNCINNLSRVSGNAVPAGSSTNTNTNTGSSTNTGTGSSNTGTGSTNTGTGSGSSTSSGTTTTTSTNALSQENAGNGNFQATSTPLIMSAGSKEGKGIHCKQVLVHPLDLDPFPRKK